MIGGGTNGIHGTRGAAGAVAIFLRHRLGLQGETAQAAPQSKPGEGVVITERAEARSSGNERALVRPPPVLPRLNALACAHRRGATLTLDDAFSEPVSFGDRRVGRRIARIFP